MAKEKGQKKAAGKPKPQLAAAFFCENIIEDKRDGSLIVVRIVDTLTVPVPQEAPPDFPSETNRLPVFICALIAFKTLDAPGPHTLRIEMESPSGKRETVLEQHATLAEVPQGGMNFTLRSTIHVFKGGLFRLHVILDDEEVVQMPLFI